MRTTIQKITAKLRQEGWSVPGEQRLASAAGLHEVRYFYPQDKPAAEAVANDINTGATDLQIAIKPVATKFVTINAKPNQGIIEVWLEVPN
jgi:hypothetical protein